MNTIEEAKKQLKKYQFLWSEEKDNVTVNGLIIRKLSLKELGKGNAVVQATFVRPGEDKEVTDTLDNFLKEYPGLAFQATFADQDYRLNELLSGDHQQLKGKTCLVICYYNDLSL